jgi:hypothetical protein
MLSLDLYPQLDMRMVAARTHSIVLPQHVNVNREVSDGSSIKETRSRQVICESMRKNAGGLILLHQPTTPRVPMRYVTRTSRGSWIPNPSRLLSNGKVKVKSPIPTASTRKRNLGLSSDIMLFQSGLDDLAGRR